MHVSPVLVSAALLGFTLLACANSRTGEAECKSFASHFIELAGQASEDAALSQQVAREMEADLLQKCLTEGTPAEIECALKARTLKEFQACADNRPD